MLVTNAVPDVDGTHFLTVASVVSSDNVTITADGVTIRNVDGALLKLGGQNGVNVGLNVSPNFASSSIINEDGAPANTVTITSHPTDKTLIKVTINSVLRTVLHDLFRKAVDNAQNDG